MKVCEPAIQELLNALAPDKVFALRAPDNQKGTFVIFQRVDSQRWRSINNPSGIAQADMQIDVYSEGYYDAKTLAGSIENALDGFSGTVYHGNNSPQDFVVIGGITLQNDVDILDQEDDPVLYRNSARYTVTYNQRET